jgi:hypothetical protein
MVVLIRKISGKRAENHVLAAFFFGINDLRVRRCLKGIKPAPCSIHLTRPSPTIGVNNTFSLNSDLHEISTSLNVLLTTFELEGFTLDTLSPHVITVFLFNFRQPI